MKNAYAAKLIAKKKLQQQEDVWEGVCLALNMTAVALHLKWGWSETRLARLEQDVQAVWDEIKEDPEVAAYEMADIIDRIRGKGFVGGVIQSAAEKAMAPEVDDGQ